MYENFCEYLGSVSWQDVQEVGKSNSRVVYLTLHNSLMENKLSSRALRIFSRKDLPIYLIVFFSAVTLKIVAESIAYPYPIGYDVINYYIPMLSNFEYEWNTIFGDYPFYTYVLHLVQNLTGLTVQTTVSTFAVFIFGLFAVSILALAKAIIKKIIMTIFMQYYFHYLLSCRSQF